MADPVAIATTEEDIWAALQVDAPPVFGPVDRAFIRELIVAAEFRIEQLTGAHPTDMDEIPADIAAAIRLDVATYYFNRLNPVLPTAWDDLIAPYRLWSFGRDRSED